MFKFLQLTDLHIGENLDEEYNNLERIINDIMSRYAMVPRPIIIITGDFVHHGTDDEYEKVVLQLKRLKKEGFPILPCPGNHDFGQGCKGHKTHYQPDARTRYLKYMHNELLGENRSLDEWKNRKTIFPIVTPIAEEKVVFLGLDTMNGVIDKQIHFGTGKVDHQQLDKAVAMLKDPRFDNYTKIVYMHHHLYSARPLMVLKQRKHLQRKLEECGVALVCFGHFHRQIVNTDNDSPVPMKLVSGRKVTEVLHENESENVLEYYEYEVGDKNVEIKNLQLCIEIIGGVTLS